LNRVLFLTESFHPVLGGGESHIRLLAGRLAARGREVAVLTRRGERDWAAEETLDGITVLRVPPSGPGRIGKYAMVPGILRALRRRRDTYDVLVVRGGRVLALPALLTARRLAKAVVVQPEVTGELSGEIYTWGTPLHRPWLREALHPFVALRNAALVRADAFVAISNAIREEMRAAGVGLEKIALIPHGVDTSRFRPADAEGKARLRRALGLPEEALLAVYTGRLLRGKGLEVLLDAFESVVAELPESRLIVVGSGAGQALSVEGSLRARASRGALSGRVTFTGRVDAVEDYLRAADVFTFPSFFEAMPLSLIEAAACGLACAASAVGGVVDVLEDGRSGLLLPAGDRPRLASALFSLLGDGALRARLGAAARERVLRSFDFETSVERYETLFDSFAPARRAA
jgi:glycosyltransferase involved in cell wall biosynthesis